MHQIILPIFIILLCLAFSSNGQNAYGKWIKINPSVTSQSMRCTFFVNPKIGWAGGRNGCIIHSIDSGNNWEVQQTPRNCWVNSIFFHDENEGWAVGTYGSLLTTNGGKQWVQRTIGNDSMRGFEQIVFLNRNIGWAISRNRITYTEDGGKTWNDRTDFKDTAQLNNILFINDSIGFLCADEFLSRTENGGKSWTRSVCDSITEIMPMKTIQMIDTSIGYCLGWFGIAKTVDGGKTWRKTLPGVISANLQTMYFSSVDTGFASTGYGSMTVLKTINGGATWSSRPLENFNIPLMSVCFPQKNKGIGVADNGAIYRILGVGDSIFEITKGTGDADLNCIAFGSAMHGFAGTGDISSFKDSVLLYSIDGGSTWNKKPTPLKAIFSMFSFDSNTIIIHGIDSSITSMAMRSADGARTWTNSGEFDDFVSFYRIKNKQNAAYGLTLNNKKCYLTLDAGKTWKKKGQLPLDTVNGQPTNNTISLYFFNTDTGLAMNNINMYRTSDGGMTWTQFSNPIPGNIIKSDMDFCSSKIGWVTGGLIEGKSTKSAIFKTEDGGLTWHEQKNVSYFPDFSHVIAFPERSIHNFTRIYADNDGKRAWALDYTAGIFHTDDGGEHWGQDTIPASPGLVFTDLAYNKFSNTLWLTSEYFGIWKYEIPSVNAVRNSLSLNLKNTGKVITTNNGILIPVRVYSEKIFFEIFDISGRLVLSRFLASSSNQTAHFVSLNVLPSGHYLGRVSYHSGKTITNAFFFSANSIK